MATDETDRASPSDEKMPDAPAHTHSFTAVNGVPAAHGRVSPATREHPDQDERRLSSSPEDAQKMNGVIHRNSTPRSSDSSPSFHDSRGHRQTETPDSQRSPLVRKRSYPEAFGDSDARDDGYDQRGDEPRRSTDRARVDHEDPRGERGHSAPNEADPHASMGQNYYPSRSQTLGDSEQRLAAAALRRESEGSITRKELATVLPDGEDVSRQQYGEYDRSSSGVQVDRDGKRRKRVFSNRTKTGCMTCRKRKKKCDELHPECKCRELHSHCAVFRKVHSSCTAIARGMDGASKHDSACFCHLFHDVLRCCAYPWIAYKRLD